MIITGLNDIEDNKPNYINTPHRGLNVAIVDIKENESPKKFLEIVFESISGDTSGMIHSERYYLLDPVKDINGNIVKKGTKWRFKNLCLACNLTNDEGKLPDDLDTTSLIGKHLTLDLVEESYISRNGEERTSLKVKNERKIEASVPDNIQF